MEKGKVPIPEGELGNIASVQDLDTVDQTMRVRHMELAHAASVARGEVTQLNADRTALLGDKVRAAVAAQAAGIALKAYESFHPEVLGDVSGRAMPEPDK